MACQNGHLKVALLLLDSGAEELGKLSCPGWAKTRLLCVARIRPARQHRPPPVGRLRQCDYNVCEGGRLGGISAAVLRVRVRLGGPTEPTSVGCGARGFSLRWAGFRPTGLDCVPDTSQHLCSTVHTLVNSVKCGAKSALIASECLGSCADDFAN